MAEDKKKDEFAVIDITEEYLKEILYLIFDYPHKHYTFKYFEVQKKLILPRIYHD